MRIEYAEVSLLGNRTDNQDRVSVAVSEHSALLVVIDGMGGHSDGAKAAELLRARGADVFRVHDVKENVYALRVSEAILQRVK